MIERVVEDVGDVKDEERTVGVFTKGSREFEHRTARLVAIGAGWFTVIWYEFVVTMHPRACVIRMLLNEEGTKRQTFHLLVNSVTQTRFPTSS